MRYTSFDINENILFMFIPQSTKAMSRPLFSNLYFTLNIDKRHKSRSQYVVTFPDVIKLTFTGLTLIPEKRFTS